MRASRSGFPISAVMSRAIRSVRASIASAVRWKKAARAGAGSAAQAGKAAAAAATAPCGIVGRRGLEHAGDGRGAPRVALLVRLAGSGLEPLAADVVAGRRLGQHLGHRGSFQRSDVASATGFTSVPISGHVDLDPVAGDEAERVGRDEAGARQKDRPGRDRVLLDEPGGELVERAHHVGGRGLVLVQHVAFLVRDPHDDLEALRLARRDVERRADRAGAGVHLRLGEVERVGALDLA